MDYLKGYGSDEEDSMKELVGGEGAKAGSEEVVMETGQSSTDQQSVAGQKRAERDETAAAPASKVIRTVRAKAAFVPPQVAHRRPNSVTEDLSTHKPAPSSSSSKP